MDANTLAEVAKASPAGALVIIVAAILWGAFTGKIHFDPEFRKLERENEELKAALAAERQASVEMARAGTVTNQLIGALTEVATEHTKTIRTRADRAPGLTAEDLGL